ncbi:unnamed protein product [Hermetia illucens]|uniref:3CxxC-type domain-containing protein n=1 Tax=Hermetia illucens TaxID=343691 RepID=A0A7R8UYN7_HERIL|nr:zinc finger CCHC domain-containing protein 24-like isoform X1 [Hermetia illucens]XP_037917028.1 zinc finger CCHC domain-containing protein 24-like isoform X2 [Hermetia illucens]CAD7088388.1 unnamed protein product [Hermetia illucens]CAD7088389.1 unnamed protein product [Hermetia illucens]
MTNKQSTPYQGSSRCFGKYKCPKCNRAWASACSWANTWQQCNACKSKVYPHNQWKLKKRKNQKPTKPDEDADAKIKGHIKELCEKCRIIGSNCLKYFKLNKKKAEKP